MSLSPQDYDNALGIAKCVGGAVLVYRTHCIGESPCGCDGWSIEEDKENKVLTSLLSTKRIYPPTWDIKGNHYVSGSKEQSCKLYQEVQRIREGKRGKYR